MSVSKDTSGRLQAIAVRNIEFFRPKPEDIPWQLLAEGSAKHNPDELRALLNLDYVRVANRIEPATTIGVYAMLPFHAEGRAEGRAEGGAEGFEFLSVAVASDFQGQLVGRRLLGHALGLAESKAAREVFLSLCADNSRARVTAQRYGFEPVLTSGDDASICELRFELTPE